MTASAFQPPFDFAAQRRMMVDCQVRTFDVTDQPLISAMLETPREIFLPERLASLAYSDMALEAGPGGAGEIRKLLAPMTLARMIQAARVRPTDKTLDVAGGGGYGAALLARLGGSALAVETDDAFTRRAQAGFDRLGLTQAQAATGAFAEIRGAFDVIVVNGAVETAPEPLLTLLSEGGRLVAIQRQIDDPTGFAAHAVLWERSGSRFGRRALFNAAAPVLPGFGLKRTFTF